MELTKKDKGKQVMYWRDGWRVGVIDSVVKVNVKIRPIAAYKAGKAHLISIPIGDIKECL